MYEYEIPDSKNGEMTQAFYKDFFLKGSIKPMLDRGEKFILEED